jgi:hypothetical protein
MIMVDALVRGNQKCFFSGRRIKSVRIDEIKPLKEARRVVLTD